MSVISRGTLLNIVSKINCTVHCTVQSTMKCHCTYKVASYLEYTAPNTPKQNGRVEKKIHTIWQKAMTMMNNTNLTLESQKEFLAEANACSAFIEDLMIKAGRIVPVLYTWTNSLITK